MNHAYFLTRMPQTLRLQIEAESVYAPWLKQGETLERIFANPAIMETVYNQMTLRERKVLRLIVSCIGCEPFDAARLEKLAQPVMSGADAKVGFLLLLRKGICYTFRKSWGEHVYVMSPDALALWQPILLEETAASGGETAAELTVTGGAGLARELFYTLVFIRDHPIRLTKSGALHKRQLQKLVELSSLQDEWFTGTGIKYAYADTYPYSIAVILEFLTRLGLLDKQGEEMPLKDSAVSGWLSLSEEEQTAVLYRIWQPVAFPGAVWLQHAALWLERRQEGQWIQAAELLQWLFAHQLVQSDAAEEDGAAVIDMLERQWLFPLIAFGWLEKGETATGKVCYRWRIRPGKDGFSSDEVDAGGGRWYVQPDFEVLVPSDVTLAARWELSYFADHIKSDHVSIYKLSKEGVQRGLESGRSLEEMAGLLADHAHYGLPDNVQLTLEQWAKPFGRLQFEQAVLLRCRDQEAADTVRKLTAAADCLAEELGERVWIVRPDQINRLTGLLDKAGWMPGKLAISSGNPAAASHSSEAEEEGGKENIRSGKAPEEPWRPEPGDKGFIYARHAIGYFEMEQRLPNVAELYPDLNGIPTGWMKDYRTYHASTRREMVEKAMEWKAALQVRHNGKDRLIAPRKLQETRGTWSMTGLDQAELQEVCWLADDVQEMKIILPGINDKY
ncbi:hypothetical protein SK3146_06528 [Paenibacillus konkukensis]|uniref:Helicase XPB/Ssl2 N-terminal domain-containing protein n=1 Tax=Paenibacillus konkukensis TaxID=2020716 RepID=A0ABY4RY49_9BACL|nr:helicase-associated domain-containing protein [Paenibacillus konkukensis]UQZ87231.1 hypothetical protein SK3146_06528 [Paenibacillus konkukensis]